MNDYCNWLIQSTKINVKNDYNDTGLYSFFSKIYQRICIFGHCRGLLCL